MSYYPPPPPGGYPPPQGGPYGGPPPQGYPGYPPAQPAYQGYPPPGGQQGYAPPGPYGQPAYPPQGGYPHPHDPYGAAPPPPLQPGQYPPQQGWDGPPPPAHPPQQPYGYQQQPYYDPSRDVEAIRKATKGFGTDENALINILARGKTAGQMEQLRKAFEAQIGKSLVHVIEKETSGWFEYGLRGLVLGPLGFDVWLVHRACAGAGTHEDLLTEVLCGRTNEDLAMLKAEYRRVYNKDLDHVIRGEVSMKTERMFNMVLAGNRPPENYPVDPRQVEDDVRTLYNAGEGRIGTDEISFCGIIFNRSNNALRAIAHEYHRRHRHTLAHAIEHEFSGHMEHSLMYALLGALNPLLRDARFIHAAMEGVGTKDERLTYRIIRAYWMGGQPHLQGIKNAYQEHYHQSLIKRVRSETSGHYEHLLVAVLEG